MFGFSAADTAAETANTEARANRLVKTFLMNTIRNCGSLKWWLGAELNRRHKDFQSSALPTELPSQTIAATIDAVYYAQVRVGGHKTRVRLEHRKTVPQAVTELQALKKRRRAGSAGKLTLPQRLAVQMEHNKVMCSRPNSRGWYWRWRRLKRRFT